MAFAFLFPGQGSQSLKMMDGFADLPVVQHTFEEASDTLSLDLWAMLRADSADAINATVNTQPIMLAAGYATYLAWQELNGKQPSVVAGHSLGEYTALVAAGALPFAEAVKLVRLRAEAMQAAVPAGAGAMAAILNLPDEDIRAACAEAAQGEVVEAVNFNSPGQVVIAGNKGAVERAMDLCKEKGAKRALPLPVSVPSHCSLMRPAAERLAEALQDVHLSAPAVPVLHNADVASYNDAAQIRDALTRQLFMPVRWTETIQKLAAEGVTLMAECGPGKVLTGLAKRIDGNVKCLALTDRAALEAAREELV
ncbi:ACP S-malonyltransferase [Chromobacterium violaceum]|uniref:Malonyl CoA-acyl carrier protein transacylase n=1 Tax=Chromobacterium violaceum TaxID=536 RepID=A0AAX2MAW0_CHRVL|nr:ACP S-malonyltransferase [Chromobacterium violaceum]OLZ87402.1 [acyl-carrier-protein] S-malonyltransferase [Chromobacterium violaceum]STB64742.1 Malonyl CoA-acyl carrier protein transacylase [Chromobacterium violaceum]SUX33667.1 Malonyl CoA-acyl carrier protein transacylase [Chromobacterium violaceum]